MIHDNHDNPFLLNNVFFVFRTSEHNTDCFFISFRASFMITSLEDIVCLRDHWIFFTGIHPFAGPYSELLYITIYYTKSKLCLPHFKLPFFVSFDFSFELYTFEWIHKFSYPGKISLKVVLSESTCCSRAGFGRKHKPVVLRPFTVGMYTVI